MKISTLWINNYSNITAAHALQLLTCFFSILIQVYDKSLCSSPCMLHFQLTTYDYLLGVADLTGELMHMCISSVANGDIESPFKLNNFLQQIHDGFSYFGNVVPYEVSKKLHTLKQSYQGGRCLLYSQSAWFRNPKTNTSCCFLLQDNSV